MAYLLGGEYCIQSLKQDVKDLLQTLADVESRTGQVKYQSWKFPDKMSCHVNVEEVLSEYTYNEEDTEESQVAHIMMYDLVIDRLVYLLQSFSHYNEILLNSNEVGNEAIAPTQAKVGKSMSVGLSAKRCWSRITQTSIALQKVAKEVNRVNSDGSDSSSNSSSNSSAMKPRFVSNKPKTDVSSGVRSISCQTAETALDNCETCSRTQQCLNTVGDEIIRICGTHSLPTSLGDWKQRFQQTDSMSIADLTRWSNYQAKDLSRISRHANSMSEKVKPLTAEIAQQKKNIDKLSKEIAIQKEVSERQKLELKEEFRKQHYLTSENEKALGKRLKKKEMEYGSLVEENEQLKQRLSKMKDDLLEKQDQILNIENEHHRLKQEAMEGMQYKQDAHQFKAQLNNAEKINYDVTQKAQADEQQLRIAEKTIKSLQSHEKSLVKKHQSLLIRLGNLSEEAESARVQLSEVEEERDDAVEQLKKMENHKLSDETIANGTLQNLKLANEEKIQLQNTLESIRNEKERLEEVLHQHEENEKLLIQYPDLNTHPPVANDTGNILDDMANQIRANELRINVLTTENNKLQQTLQSMNKTNFNGHDTTNQYQPAHNSPVQLWQRNQDENLNLSFNTSYTTSEQSTTRQEDMFHRSASRTKYKSKTMVAPKQGASVIDVYKESKANMPTRTSFTVGSGKRPPSSRSKTRRPISAKSELYKPWT